MMETRNRNIDGIKGFLIVMVILGHVLQGRLDQHIGRYVIYGFHMPIFIAVAGFLFSFEKSKTLQLGEFLGKYWGRVLLPWCLAMLAYAIYLGAFGHSRPEWKGWIAYLLNPYYHLWFVPAYIFWGLMVWCISQISTRREWVLAIGLLIAWTFFYMKANQMDLLVGWLGTDLSGFVLHVLRPHYFVFFVLGVWARNERIPTPTGIFAISGLGLFALYFALFYFHEGVSPSMTDLIWVFGNAFFILGLFRWMAADALPKSQVFEWMGRQSMGIYLWHVMPLLLVKDFMGTRQLDVFYPVVFVAELILLALIFIVWKYWRGAKLLLGGG